MMITMMMMIMIMMTYFSYPQLRENIITRITKLRMNDTKSVNQVASVLVEATKEEAAITPTSGVSGINYHLPFLSAVYN